MIWIRADANSEIGMGHVMRCLSIAEALGEQGCEVRFLLADDMAVPLLEAKGQCYEILDTDFGQMETELPLLQKLAEEEGPAVCLIDSYFVTPYYLEQMGKNTNTVYMDDKFSFPYPVDMVINYNIYGDLLPYRETARKSGTAFLLGTAYAPLRREFLRRTPSAVSETVQNVLITTGGSDKYNLAGQILREVMVHTDTQNFHYHVVSGVFNTHLSELQQMAECNSRIHIHQNVNNMVELMELCDVAVSAGGSTMYELCAVGVPIICFSFVDNQEKIVETFLEKQLVCYGGNYRKEKDKLAENVVRHLVFLANNPKARAEYSRKEQELVDGRGAERIALALKQMEEHGKRKPE